MKIQESFRFGNPSSLLLSTSWLLASAKAALAFSSVRHVGLCEPQSLTWTKSSLLFQLPLVLVSPSSKRNENAIASAASSTAIHNDKPTNKVRIGIVGGGIAGVSLAYALVRRNITQHAEITVLEGGMPEAIFQRDMRAAATDWKAATARNGQSIVPGASFMVNSRLSELKQVITDTVKEWYWRQREQFADRLGLQTGLARNDNFDIVPPYFSLQLWNCLGPSATHDERMTFIRFGVNFLYTVFSGKDPDERGRALLKLSLSNRALYDAAVADNAALKTTIGHSIGFISFFRSAEAADANVQACRDHGVAAERITWDEAIQWEPHIANIPIRPLFGVRRPHDYTANSNELVRYWRNETTKQDIQFVAAHVDKVEREHDGRFRVAFTPQLALDDTNSAQGQQEFDILVLSAGAETALLARQLGAAKYCPVYPLRGFSLTIFVDDDSKKSSDNNLLHQPFKIDAMYSSSVSPYTARWVGFGEFAGYPRKNIASAGNVKSIAPKILTRYAQALFPEAKDIKEEQALPCYRSLSPDDLPVVGPVKEIPGLYLHTGHGSLGWTTGLATGDILAQQIENQLAGNSEGSVHFADGTSVDEALFSPDRFL